MTQIFPQRMTAECDGDFGVFAIDLERHARSHDHAHWPAS